MDDLNFKQEFQLFQKIQGNEHKLPDFKLIQNWYRTVNDYWSLLDEYL